MKNKSLKIEIIREANLKDIFGSMERKIPAQDFKNMVRGLEVIL